MDIHMYNVKALPSRERLFDVCCDQAPQRVVGIDWDNLTVSGPVTDTLGIDRDNLTVSAPVTNTLGIDRDNLTVSASVTNTQYKHICVYTLMAPPGNK